MLTAPSCGRPASLVSPARKWWRGLDSNQRTLARADLQSAAFNHSATSPGAGRRAKWRAEGSLSTAAGTHEVAWAERQSRPSLRSCASRTSCPRHAVRGAGEGNRTLVVSLEGFCSTIELHPPDALRHPAFAIAVPMASMVSRRRGKQAPRPRQSPTPRPG